MASAVAASGVMAAMAEPLPHRIAGDAPAAVELNGQLLHVAQRRQPGVRAFALALARPALAALPPAAALDSLLLRDVAFFDQRTDQRQRSPHPGGHVVRVLVEQPGHL